MFRNMTEKNWKEFFQKESELKAERIMNQVNSDPTLKDVHAPGELRDSLVEQIEEYENAKEGGR